MQTEAERFETHMSDAGTDSVIVCSNCHVQMPCELRFCRACGFRLGEGVAEFTETVRFQNSPTAAAKAKGTNDAPPNRTAAAPTLSAFGGLNEWGALGKDLHQKAVKGATKHFERQQRKQQRKQERHRSHWMGWLMLIIIISMVSGGFAGLRGLRNGLRGSSGSSTSASRSWVGVNSFKTAAGGVTFDKVEPPGSPTDKAGLVGGDVITIFDGQPVKNAEGMTKLLATTPIGKTVEVIYIRDGETRTTKLTTISEGEKDRLEAVAEDAPQGYVGIGGDYDQVAIPGATISGVRLNSVRRNNPAYIAGIRDGDIVIAFDNVPIRTYDELESRTRRAVPDSTVKVIVMRGSERLEIPVKVGTEDD